MTTHTHVMRCQALPLKRDLLEVRRPFFVNVDKYAFAVTVGVLIGYLIWG